MPSVLFTPEIFTFQRVGGISRYFCDLARNIPRDQWRARIPAGIHRNEYLRHVGGVAGVYIPRLGPLGHLRLTLNQNFFRMYCSRDASAVLHQTYYSEVDYPASHPVVLTVPDMIDELFPERPTAVPPGQKLRNCKRADRIIAISQATKNDIIKILGISPEKITVIYLADSLSRLSTEPARPAGLNHDYVVFVGIRGGYKNFKLLLQAFATSRSLPKDLTVVAFGGGEFTPEEVGYIQSLGLSNRVVYRYGDDVSLASSYRHAKAMIYPSTYEGFGLPVLEAMGQGCPVICSNPGGSVPEIAGDAAAYFDGHDVVDMQTVLEATLGDAARLRQLRERGFERHRQFSWEKCAQETLEVYRNVA